MPDNDTPTPPSTPVDTVVDLLIRDRIGRADRGRLGKALDSANKRADGDVAGRDEAFGRIRGG